MKRAVFVVLVTGAVLTAAACQQSPTGPSLASAKPAKSITPTEGTTSPSTPFDIGGLMGTWQATRAEGWRVVSDGNGGFVEVAGSRRDLVAEGGTVTLAFQPNSQPLGRTVPPGTYTVTVAMPGAPTGVDTGFWHAGPAWQEQNKGLTQIDFYPARLLPDAEYGELPAFLYILSGDTLKLWDAGLSFLPFDFGWSCWETSLSLEFTRR